MKRLIAAFLIFGAVSHESFASEMSPRDLARQIIAEFKSGQRSGATQASNTLIFEKAAKDYPDDASIHFALATCYMAQKNPSAGVASMEKAYAASKKDPEIGLMYALALKMNKEPLKAYSVNKEMVATRPEIPQLQISLATLDMAIQKYDEAIEILESLMAKAPVNLSPRDKASLLFMLGTCHLHKGEHHKAISLLEESNALSPNAAVPLDALGHAYLKAGEPEKAKDVLNKALAINPRFPSALYYKGLYFERSNSPELAPKCFQDSYAFGKQRLNDNGQDYYLMAEVCTKLSKPEEAHQYKEQAAQLLYTYDAPWKTK